MRRNYSESSFLQNWARILIWINIDFIKIYRRTIYKTDYSNDFQSNNICVHILCRFSDTGIIMTSKRRCYARDLQNHAYIFHNAWFATSRFGTSLVNFGFRMYQNQIIHVIIGFKHDVSGATRIRQCTRRYAPRALTDPRGPFVPPISQCTIHHA